MLNKVIGTTRKTTGYSYWICVNIASKFFKWLSKQLGIKQMADWYKLTAEEMENNGGLGLLGHFGGSPSKALQSVYPEHKWEVWKFCNSPMGYWDDLNNQQAFFCTLEKELGLRDWKEYYKLKRRHLAKWPQVQSILRKHNQSSFETMRAIYPQHSWEPGKFFW